MVTTNPDLSDYRSFDVQQQRCRSAIAAALRGLLETKHLYQSVSVAFPPLMVSFERPDVGWVLDSYHTDRLKALVLGPWAPIDVSVRSRQLSEPAAADSKWLSFRLPTVKTFCSGSTCQRIEAFNPIGSTDCLGPNDLGETYSVHGDRCSQVFSFSYVCQSCKGLPEVFLVRREGAKLTASGRTPIEHIEVPAVIPKAAKKYFSDAVVAYQSGQILAGVFMLRVLIEQWVRLKTDNKHTFASQAIEAYVESLPVNFRSEFPVLRDLYEKLSVDIHSATGSPVLFEEGHADIVRHFDARRLFRLDPS